MASADEIASAGTYLSKNTGIETTDGTQVRVTLGVINSTTGDDGAVTPIDYGLKVVSSDGSTVIIDGTSDIFKITATGTTTLTIPATSTASTIISLTGLGVVSVSPAHLGFIADNSGSGSNRLLGHYWEPFSTFDAAASGGATTNEVLTAQWHVRVATIVTASTVSVSVVGQNVGAASHDFYIRYYTLLEAGM